MSEMRLSCRFQTGTCKDSKLPIFVVCQFWVLQTLILDLCACVQCNTGVSRAQPGEVNSLEFVVVIVRLELLRS